MMNLSWKLTDSPSSAVKGVDVSHRGGKPGFVWVDSDRLRCKQSYQTLIIPDFSGNKHFNTFGNLELNSRAGLLFIDFNQGDLLYFYQWLTRSLVSSHIFTIS